jgi:hypothetical protein
MEPIRLAISIVVYAPVWPLLEQTLASLERAVGYARSHRLLASVALILVDNGPTAAHRVSASLQALLGGVSQFDEVELLSGHGNIGYGAGHNRAMAHSHSDFHLVINADVAIAEDALYQALHFMQAHPQAGLLAPAVSDEQGQTQYLCKRYPAIVDLLLRGFAPCALRRLFRRRLARYEMRDLIDSEVVWDVPIVSGCFMLFRTPVLTQLRGFEPAYFLYFEDFDLSLRAARVTRIVYVPAVRIVHSGGYAARKGWRHIGLFLRAALIFYHRHGWRWL